MVERLYLKVMEASKYIKCSKEELIAWVEPDRRLPNNGARLWLPKTLDAAKPNVSEWRKRDRAVEMAVVAKREADYFAAVARRSGMRKGGALVASKVCAFLNCSLTELNRWAADGRLPPDGEILLTNLPKMVNARAWLPETLENAKASLNDWREQDKTKKSFKRRGLRSVK